MMWVKMFKSMTAQCAIEFDWVAVADKNYCNLFDILGFNIFFKFSKSFYLLKIYFKFKPLIGLFLLRNIF